MSALLALSDLSVNYGSIRALSGVSLEVGAGEIVALIGPNGAGKSSLVNAVAGNVRMTGALRFQDEDLARATPEARVRKGLCLVPEGRHVMQGLTVEENLLLGASIRRDRAAIQSEIARFYDLFPILAERRRGLAGLLSGGEQQQLVICRALMARPRLLILDEPSLGLAPLMTERIYEVIRDVRDRGIAVLVVEQSAARCFELADRIHVLNHGAIRLSGRPADLGDPAAFEAAYFGVGEDAA